MQFDIRLNFFQGATATITAAANKYFYSNIQNSKHSKHKKNQNNQKIFIHR